MLFLRLSMNNKILETVTSILQQQKAKDILELDIKDLTTIADYMIIVTATSTAHAKGICNKIVTTLKVPHTPKSYVEGDDTGEWILIDLDNILINIMLEETREFYNLEELWKK